MVCDTFIMQAVSGTKKKIIIQESDVIADPEIYNIEVELSVW